MTLFLHFIYSFGAIFFFALVMITPKKAVLPDALIGALGYLIYECIFNFTGHEIFGYFCGTVFIASAGEILARALKMPSIIFVFPAVIPLVPGVGLYKTMLTLVENRPQDFMQEGVNTLFIAGTMAISVALVNVIIRNIPHRKIKKKTN
ncbi:MAG: hypothetical protein DBX47_01995 [Clostridiales bacterium]|nr:MAG: hypothetical protein DBX47_01995 [Clostridiales bacterium]